MSFSVLTLNLWNVSEPLAERFSALAQGLKTLRPDIVCLQEVARDPRSGRSQAELVADACQLAHHVKKGALAILARMPIVRSESAALPEFARDEPRQVLLAELVIERRPVLVANTHLAHHLDMIQERTIQVEALLAAIHRDASTAARKTTILCGDFNDVPESPALRKVLASSEGLRDAYARCHPGKPGFTYSRSNPYVGPSWPINQRIDFIFTAGDLAATDCAVVFDGNNGLGIASDHFGVFGNLEFR